MHFLHKSGTALPGLVILKIYPKFLEDTIGKFPEKIILVTGTNGKTTTSHLISHLLKKSKKQVFHNHEGSNMERGIASEILKLVPAKAGNYEIDYFVIEADEGSFPKLLQILKPKTVVLLNIFRDQLDRYGEINGLMNKWQEALKKNPPKNLIFNADDPNLTRIVEKFTDVCINDTYHCIIGYSVAFLDGDNLAESADRVFCPECNSILKYEGSDFKCETCGFSKKKPQAVLQEGDKELIFNYEPKIHNESLGIPPLGKYNYYNLAAAATTYINIGLNTGVSLRNLLSDSTPAFGRFEKIFYKNKFFYVILAKNPSGMDQVLKTLRAEDLKPENLMMALNDKIADGEDVSWIYDVDFETHQQTHLLKNLIVSGVRAFDLALRLKIAEKLPENYKIDENLKSAFEEFLKNVLNSKQSVIIVTYTCLIELQKIMYKKKLIKQIM